MFKQIYVLEVKGAKDKLYRFECDSDAPLGEIHDVLFTMKAVVVKQLEAQHDKEGVQEESAEEDKKEEKE